MNYKKGLVALAITGALATPIAANAAQLVTYGGKMLSGQADDGSTTTANGPQASTQSTVTALLGINADGVDVKNDDLTVDKVYLNGSNFVVDLDADTGTGVGQNDNDAFPGSNRTDVSIGYSSVVSVPNEATFEITLTGQGGLNAAEAASLVFVAQIGSVDPASNIVGTVPGQMIAVGSVIDFTVEADGTVRNIVIQIDTNLESVRGVGFVLAGNDNTDSITEPNVTGTTFVLDAERPDGTKQVMPLNESTLIGNFLPAESLPADIQLFLASPSETIPGDYNPVTMEIASTATVGDTIDMTVTTVTNTAGLVLNALATGTSNVITITDGFQVNIIDQATTTIDVETDSTTFIDCVSGVNSDDEVEVVGNVNAPLVHTCDAGVPLVSRAVLQLDNAADYGVELLGTETTSVSFSRLHGEGDSGVASVALGGSTFTQSAGDVYTTTATVATLGLSGPSNTFPLTSFDITANGVDPLIQNDTSGMGEDWTISSFVINSATGALNVPVKYDELTTHMDDKSVAVDAVTHVWDINGSQFKIPYVYSIAGTSPIAGSTTTNSTIKIVNEFVNDAAVHVDVVVASAGIDSEVDATGNGVKGRGYVDNTFQHVYLGTVPGEGHLTMTGFQIAEKLGLDTSMNWHLELTYLVSAPQNFVHAAAQNVSATGRADTPVLYKTNNASDGRQWQ